MLPYNPAFTPEQNALLAQMNFDEAKVGLYELPECFGNETNWEKRRRELLGLFETHVYGRRLPKAPVEAEIFEESHQALDGRAIRRQVRLRCLDLVLNLIVYIPRERTRPAPCFLGLNFCGNHAAFPDAEIPLSERWIWEGRPGVVNHRATEASRGTDSSRWPLELILERGFALATCYYGDIEPDHEGGLSEGPRRGATEERGDEAGAITAWAWGLCRAMDYLETLPEIDAARVCLTGHSRLGKTVLWAAAGDPRFALVIANNSGCAGGALSRRNFGETLHILSNVRPYWFCRNCREQSHDIDRFPVDQHQLIALCAPRPVFLSCAADDLPADPLGEFLALRGADEVYRSLGTDGFPVRTFPAPNEPAGGTLGYCVRPGGHDITAADWRVHLDFAATHLPEKPVDQ